MILFLPLLDFTAAGRVLALFAAPPHQITLLMCSLNPGCVALAALLWQKQTGAHYVIHSAQPFCRVNLQLVLIHLAPRGGGRPAAVIQSVESQLGDLAGRLLGFRAHTSSLSLQKKH